MSSDTYPSPGNERAVHEAWEAFLAGAPLRSDGALRPVVDASWQRSRIAQVDPCGMRGPMPVTDEVLHQLHEDQYELLEASAPVMACARDFLSKTGTIMVLTNRDSTILSFEGDTRTKRRAEDIRLIPGVNWAERYCGTNAIGTALAVAQPVQIHSSEHFVEGIKRWTCSAAVVRHPLDGEILGVLDVSGLSASYSRQNLALVVTTAARIENRLMMVDTERRYRLLDKAMTHWANVNQVGAILFDRRGVPVKMNANARLAIADVGGDTYWLDTRRLPALATDAAPVDLPAWIQPEWLHPMSAGNERLGTLLVIPASRRVSRLTSLPRDPMPTTAGAMEALVFDHASMRQVVHRARQLAGVQTPVLLQGETGTGKEAFARGLHGTRKGAYVALNCGGLARELLVSELFGYVEGAFTGARKGGMPGKIEAANGGTLFLDEIGELPMDMQPLLLRVLEQGEVWRLGENMPRRVDFRLVAATHRDLRADVAAGRFRMDLYYRIAVTSLHVPALRERGDDVLLLAQHYLAHFRREAGQSAESLSNDVADCLHAYDWPGNVRELRNVMEAAVLISEGSPLTLSMLPPELQQATIPMAIHSDAAPAAVSAAAPVRLNEAQAMFIRRAIDAADGNLTRAARQLGIAKSTLYAKMRTYGLNRAS
ncbi:MAG: sigma-54-dependent Fis family transcriptional regulator [Rhodanobacter sp.]|jgi:transcriptional regulator of acetoin/glycerol metabolism|nr:sigma-54-dependent Fis family transcriptional regulator [Rhodanobacter sp.]